MNLEANIGRIDVLMKSKEEAREARGIALLIAASDEGYLCAALGRVLVQALRSPDATSDAG